MSASALHPAAAQSLLVRRKSRLGPFLVGSIAAHAGLVVAGLLLGHFFSAPPMDLDQKPITAKLVRLGKKRDQKLLPRKEEPPPPPPKAEEAKPEPAVEKPPPEKAVAIPDKAPPKPVAHAKQEGKKNSDSRSQLFGAFNKLSKPKPDEPLEGDENGSPEGDSATAEGDQYWALLTQQVHRNYDVSQTIPQDERLHLRAQVAVRINRAGRVLEVKLARPSGNALFDNAVMAAVKKASPFSPPPDKLRDSLETTGVVLEFTP